ncbi:acetyltransferase GNAT family [Bifidobacterium sp. GSD1FS]|uniref:Acetyltransferase GNAT family n=2 Tax=Bifidobacterium canis TaxID=2610880 RepID=A0A7K1J3A1_9BIFI|nr:acetyltransferase GNAT family [Bifidobacterium canis]
MLTAQNNIDMREIEHNDRNSELVSQLVTVWEASVRATHTFLTNAQIEQIREYVPDALRGIEHLVVAFDGAQPVGFMGVDGQRLEMLFLSPDYRGQGLGARLLRDGIANYNVNELTVNEQNPQAFAFYEHMGFHTVSRSELDEQGNPFPILTMRLD